MDDMMYPNDGAYFSISEPVEQKVEKQKEQSRVREAKKILDDVIERFESRIKFYETLDSIPDEVQGIPEDFMLTVSSNKLTKRNLQAELEWLMALRDTK